MATNNAINNTLENYKFTSYLSAVALNVTGDTTGYNIICDTAFGSSVYDNTTGIWTCPETGLYVFGGSANVSGLSAAYTVGDLYLNINSLTFETALHANNPGADNTVMFRGSLMMSCTIGDTVQLEIVVGNSTKTISIGNAAPHYNKYATSFWGFKV